MSDPKQAGVPAELVKIDDLELSKETLEDLSEGESDGVHGRAASNSAALPCSAIQRMPCRAQ